MNIYIATAREKLCDGTVSETRAVFSTPTNTIEWWAAEWGLDATKDERFRYAKQLETEEFIMLRGGGNRDIELVADRMKVDSYWEAQDYGDL